MVPSDHWRELQRERLAEAVRTLSAVPGVHGLIVGGSLGRGEAWPMSDIDLLPIYTVASEEVAAQVERRQAELVGWWTASGRPQALDLGWLAFTVEEAKAATSAGPDFAVERLRADKRWFHGMDKAYGGSPADPDDELTRGFLDWIGANRFDPTVVEARLAWWRESAAGARDRAYEARAAERLDEATYFLREAARALRHVVLEGWGERLGSMGREWTRFERMAETHGGSPLAERIAVLAGAHADECARREALAPRWLRERIDLCWSARLAVGEQVSRQANARDQIAAFAVHVARHRPDLAGPWTGSPDPALDEHLADLDEVYAEVTGEPARPPRPAGRG
ncbi:nucleotidyltransferase domain-containing protein [Actinopolymorpha alba]|uniref:nucleotidyltransferase domain-containing protein n=1 Tax=Actinopolymorpha alba TaxID=533267 RepID=UPI0003710E36|nr:nucleotidyltransferase domain-containing protein [Actinopolymorpha alba]